MKTVKLFIILLIQLLILSSCTEDTIDTMDQETGVELDSMSLSISIEGLETSAFTFRIDTISDVRYLISFDYQEDDSVHIESLFVRTDLIQIGSFSLDNTVEERVLDGIMRVRDTVNIGTSFSFLNHDQSFGSISIDSIVNHQCFGSFDFEVVHPVDERLIRLSCEFNAIPEEI